MRIRVQNNLRYIGVAFVLKNCVWARRNSGQTYDNYKEVSFNISLRLGICPLLMWYVVPKITRCLYL